MLALAQWLSETQLSLAIQKILWLIPLLQTIHILAIAMVMSSVLMIALRVLRAAPARPIAETAHRFMPWVWTGLVLLAATGITLILGEPKRSLPNPAFQIKMLMLAVAITTICVFQVSVQREAAFWDGAGRGRAVINVLAIGALVLWCAIAVAGRWIAYIKVT